MKSVLVLGAGMVAKPLVNYLLDCGHTLTITDIDLARAKALVEGRANGHAIALEIHDRSALGDAVDKAQLVISLLPPRFHLEIAEICLERRRHFLTASYVTPELESLEAEVRKRNLIFMNEVGLDPGLDHMTVMEMLSAIRERGHRITQFRSHAGGLPSQRSANNPLRYKFSWNPEGVFNAITRASKFRENNRITMVPGEENLHHADILHIPRVGIFESNPNADAIYYTARYGLEDVPDVRRGTLRYPMWAPFWRFMLREGFFGKTTRMSFHSTPVIHALFQLAGYQEPPKVLQFMQAKASGLASFFLEVWHDLGLFSDLKVTGDYSAFDLILELARGSMRYAPDETDRVILYHEFLVETASGKEKWTSVLDREGRGGDDTAMAELVGLPAAITGRLILEGKTTQRGVLIPLEREVFEPVLKELASLGIRHSVHIEAV